MMPEIAPLEAGEPRRLGPFRIVGRIGEGGQGIVYLGVNESGERAAIKLLHVKFSGDSVARSRFAREARAAQRVASFCTAGVIGVDLEGDTPYIASEYIEGRSLQEAVETDGPLRGTALQRLAIGTATALTAIHQAAIVHRDFKPDNVLIAADGPRVVDFGIARIVDSTGTITSRAIGTPAYMAPEQISGADVGPHTDVFAWGATIVFAATGEIAFAGNSIAVVLNRILNHEVDVGAMPEPLRGVVRSALSKSPAARPSAGQILLRLLGHPETVDASPADLNEGAQVAGPDSGEATSPMRVPVRPPTWRGSGGRPTPFTGPPVPAPGHGEPLHSEPPATVPPAWQPTVPNRSTDPDRSGRPHRGRWAAAAVAAALLATVVAVLAVTGWPPRFGTAVQPTDGPTESVPATFASVADKAAKTGRLTVGMRDFLPGVALNSGGRWSGFEVDLATEIAKALGVPASGITFRATSREERPELLARGDLDLVVSTYSINKSDDVTFAGPYYLAHVDVLVKDGSPILSAADLKGKRICQPAGSGFVRTLQGRVGQLTPVPVATYTDCMNKLLSGEVDAVPGDDLVLAGFGNRESVGYKVLGLKLTDERYAVALKKGDGRTCKAVQGVIADLYRSGAMSRLLDRHFSKVDFATREDDPPAMASCG
ncbi:bifunctional serine/threonine-protein kinase/glutamate ABC transporter substrate-binding protein [Streptosporangium sp. NBC_01756]|uniref:bifunctional serine/threonine-protein kinase/glutamate ABC transporter substrate-binding protein n=1 Tax=Streptosporangium sp. NBC_01756 TaxID=2975950 RepID=UPI002DDC6D63|nr:bifunctional serine/threonine-protein kinase/glutamate ABC transporter substrate-binding protein [Streptosporangium sp. NBC_01756]WSC83651.1 bifunctional serine/threonine-protein kinase/glutamate ABC transporter substrate-binding protein [Streptosporangium sp. NBC_01756]